MAGFAVDSGDVIRMGVLLDIGMAVIALQASMHAGAELVAIDRDAVARCILHGLVAVASQAIRLRDQPVRHGQQRQRQEPQGDGTAPSNGSKQAERSLACPNNNCSDERNNSCGFRHAAVSSSMA